MAQWKPKDVWFFSVQPKNPCIECFAYNCRFETREQLVYALEEMGFLQKVISEIPKKQIRYTRCYK